MAANALSEDHKPNRSDERKRIENAGGVVMWAGEIQYFRHINSIIIVLLWYSASATFSATYTGDGSVLGISHVIFGQSWDLMLTLEAWADSILDHFYQGLYWQLGIIICMELCFGWWPCQIFAHLLSVKSLLSLILSYEYMEIYRSLVIQSFY